MIFKTPSQSRLLLYLCILAVMTPNALTFPAGPVDDRYVDREFASPGGHQLASWLIAKLRKDEDFLPMQELPAAILQQPPYRLPAGKRNSELTSVMLGFPKSMIDNGR